MAPLTRWVLAHKRLVVIFWVALTLVGMASAGSATQALMQKFSVPGREGWVTNQQIAGEFRGTGGQHRAAAARRHASSGAHRELSRRARWSRCRSRSYARSATAAC